MPCSLFVSTESYYLISNQTTFFTRYQALYWKSRKKNSDSISLSEWSVRCRKLATQTINRIRTRMNTSYLDNCPRSLSKCHRQVRKKQSIFWTQFSNGPCRWHHMDSCIYFHVGLCRCRKLDCILDCVG